MKQPMPFVVVITGGIGCGKSTVAQHFTELGTPLVDTDAIAHRLTRAPSPQLDEIVRIFGPQALLDNGDLNRSWMRQRVFADTRQRKLLEDILHPAIRQAVLNELRELHGQPYVLLAVPLYFESAEGYRSLAQRVLLVDCTPEQQIERTMQRSGLSRQQVEAIMHSQVSREFRLQRADDVIDNSETENKLHDKIIILHQHYLTLANNFKKST